MEELQPSGQGQRSSRTGGGGGGAEPIGYVEIGPGGATFTPIEDANRMPSPGLVLVAGISAALILRALAKLLRG